MYCRHFIHHSNITSTQSNHPSWTTTSFRESLSNILRMSRYCIRVITWNMTHAAQPSFGMGNTAPNTRKWYTCPTSKVGPLRSSINGYDEINQKGRLEGCVNGLSNGRSEKVIMPFLVVIWRCIHAARKGSRVLRVSQAVTQGGNMLLPQCQPW